MANVNLDLGEWEVSFKKALSQLSDKRSLLEKSFLLAGIKDIIAHFGEERGPDGSWASRSEKTQEAYARIKAGYRKAPEGIAQAAFNPSNKLLQLTGYLRKSVLNPQIRMKTNDTLEVMSLVGYSGVHDEGSEARGIPQRSFMWLTESAQATMAQIIIEAVGKEFA